MSRRDHQDRLVDSLLRDRHGPEPDLLSGVQRRIEERKRHRRILRLGWVGALGAAAAVLWFLAAGQQVEVVERPPVERPPQEEALALKGIAQVIGPLERGSTIKTGEEEATLNLGSYASVRIQPHSTVRVEKKNGEEEALFLRSGEVICDVEKKPEAGFSVKSDAGSVKVVGTVFSVKVVRETKECMMRKKLICKVLAGAVLMVGLNGVTSRVEAMDRREMHSRWEKMQKMFRGGGMEDMMRKMDPAAKPQSGALGVLVTEKSILNKKIEVRKTEIQQSEEMAAQRTKAIKAIADYFTALEESPQHKELEQKMTLLKEEQKAVERPKTREGYREYWNQMRELKREEQELKREQVELHMADPKLATAYKAREETVAAYDKALAEAMEKDEALKALIKEAEVLKKQIGLVQDEERVAEAAKWQAQREAWDKRKKGGEEKGEKAPDLKNKELF